MGSHLYTTRFNKIYKFIERFGLSQLFMKPIRIIFAPFIIYIYGIKNHDFLYNSNKYSLFCHKYNTTWINERAIEIPIISHEINNLSPHSDILEIGNVLSHYFYSDWEVVDKFEKGNLVINKDILDFNSERKYKLIISISTLEHIGFDDDSGDSYNKIQKAFYMITKLLLPNGRFIFTVPIGYNPFLDNLIQENKFSLKDQKFIKKFTKHHWEEVTKSEALKCKYGSPFPYANCIMVGEYRNSP